MGREVADAADPVCERVPPPAIGIHGRPAAYALVDELEDRLVVQLVVPALETLGTDDLVPAVLHLLALRRRANDAHAQLGGPRSEEQTSELQSLMRISYAVFCLKKKKKNTSQLAL